MTDKLATQPPLAAKVEFITPDLADLYLKTMVGNRHPSDKRVVEYALSMEAGQWRLNGETIKFDDGGRLIDGQQRLRACGLANVGFSTYVVRGLTDPEAFATVDIGKVRSHADVFAINGWQNNRVASAAAMLVYCVQNNMLSWGGPLPVRPKRSGVLKRFENRLPLVDPVPRDVLDRFADGIRPDLEQAVRFANSSRAKKLLPAATIAGLYYLFKKNTVSAADQFFTDLGDGLGLKRDDPVYVLRERLLGMRAPGVRSERWAVVGLTIKAWNKRRANAPLSRLVVAQDEPFPKVK